ncbi:unnamed protein product [Dracunculus medinensis]|uniref:GRAM domain-containing protein n=1 Tax=Dracunculus medinensis TaxID=318479 RepID=A0A0N4UD43_DRAME|nr:unnamed protein product [Dracunculus medinensis]
MSINTSNTQDGYGVLIYNGEMILIYIDEVVLQFSNEPNAIFKGKKCGNLYLTGHRIIFINRNKDEMRSFSMPFHCLRNVRLEQPVLGANYLIGEVVSQPGGNWDGKVTWKLTFNKGGCIDFGMALLKATDMAHQFRPYNAPPPYAPPPGFFFAAPPCYYMPPNGMYNGFQAPVNVFPDQPPVGNVFIYEAPPPYTGIGPNQPPIPGDALRGASAPQEMPPAYYQQAGPLPQKS